MNYIYMSIGKYLSDQELNEWDKQGWKLFFLDRGEYIFRKRIQS